MLNIISSPKVKKIINLLLTSEKSLTEISHSLKVSKPSALKYLNSMETLGLITSKYHTTKIGREKKFKIHTFSSTLSIDPIKGVIFFCNQDPLDIKNPLIGQIKQNKFRSDVNIYLEQVLDILKMKFAVVIYGSIARGEATSKSDLDILFLAKNDWGKNNKSFVMNALYKGSIATQVQAKPLFWTLEKYITKKDILSKKIKQEGLIIYDSIGQGELWKVMKRYWNISG
jgi:hypothetical protein